jgi:hypothetical protein
MPRFLPHNTIPRPMPSGPIPSATGLLSPWMLVGAEPRPRPSRRRKFLRRLFPARLRAHRLVGELRQQPIYYSFMLPPNYLHLSNTDNTHATFSPSLSLPIWSPFLRSSANPLIAFSTRF